ncbi:alpha-N-acetylglucosaminidase [Asticcacaulis sp. 201]|uniref:alpha-N-acetylglucosaminidase n=1 Tax=Asticcacaulis sp. 201 TaxID=3028787 RepID=UPI002916A5AC|nr:alpha-N-acetylglucosaminidase [Asticcacaulis sp. 201]MDV6330902.1 alpha-N-acetylglucosaminidase [Asticcacaulis sp. 201]
MLPHLSRRHFLATSLSVTAVGLGPASAWSSIVHSDPSRSAHAVATRLLGKRAHSVAFQLVSSPDDAPWYAVKAEQGRLTVTANSPVALTRGLYSYLKDEGLADVSWEGDRVDLPRHWPNAVGARVKSPFRHRVYLNTCAFGYTTPWWGWRRWEREIDWMALHGIDMPLAMEGQEYVWQALWRENGLSESELQAYFSGPAFTPWQRMGNIEGYDAPLPQAWIVKKRDLQQRILGRLRELGMTPILPAFGGYVPKAFAEKHPEARIYKMRAWEGFHETYWLDPADPLFAKLAGRFIALYTETYGEGQYYLADSFNEMLPPIAPDGSDAAKATYGDATANTKAVADVDPAVKAARLAAYGEAIYASIRQARPDAVWVMQGWLFGADRAFWSSDAIGAFLSKVPDEKLMVLDIGNDRYPDVWTRSDAFKGKAWIYGYVHNYGGSNPVYGDLDFYRSDLKAITQSDAKRNLKGFGLFPEGLHSNSVVYEYAYDLAWGDVPVSDWLKTYTRARYGQTSPALLSAWSDLQKAVYQTRYWTPRWWKSRAGAYLLFKRPTLDATEFPALPGDRDGLKTAVSALLALAPTYGASKLFRNDVVDATRHYTAFELDACIQAAIAAYQSGDLTKGDADVKRLTDLVLRLDALLGAQQETLSSWIDDARAYGDTAAEKVYYVENAKAQVTVWGGKGNLNDYASKAWQGLYAGFYLPRWTRFFAALRQSIIDKTPFDQARFTTIITDWEHEWVKADQLFARHVPADPMADAKALLEACR